METTNNGTTYVGLVVKTFSAKIRAKLDSEINDWLNASKESGGATLVNLKFSTTTDASLNVTYSAFLIYGYAK